jgi:hypothetical protein
VHIGTIPDAVKTLDQAIIFSEASRPRDREGNSSLGNIWRSEDMIVVHGNHAIIDGGFIQHLLDAIARKAKPVDPYYIGIHELIGNSLSKAGTYVKRALDYSYMTDVVPWHATRADPQGRCSVHSEAIPVQELPFFDRVSGRLRDSTENQWACLIASTIAYNFRATGRVILDRSGLWTFVNLRPFAEIPFNPANVGSAFSFVVPSAGAVDLGETLEAITSRMRKSMKDAMADDEHFRGSWTFNNNFGPATGKCIGMALSSVGKLDFRWPIIDGKLAQLVENHGVGELLLPSTWTVKTPTREDFCVKVGNNPAFFGDEDANTFFGFFTKALRRVDLRTTLRELLRSLTPGID